MVPVTDDITPPPPLDRKESSVQDDGTAPHERLEDASSLGDVDQDLPELSGDQVSSGERRHLTAEEIFNQPEVPIEVPGAGTSIRPFIRHNESADVFQDALDDGLSDREFAVRALARLTTNPQLTPDQVAAWPDELIVAAIRLLVASDEYLAPPGEEVTIESFSEAGRREATEDQRRWDELAKRVTAFYPGAHIAKQIAELNVAEKFAKLAQPDYNAISGFLDRGGGGPGGHQGTLRDERRGAHPRPGEFDQRYDRADRDDRPRPAPRPEPDRRHDQAHWGDEPRGRDDPPGVGRQLRGRHLRRRASRARSSHVSSAAGLLHAADGLPHAAAQLPAAGPSR